MHTDISFKVSLRDNENKLITTLPKNGREIKIKYYKEKPGNDSALVHVSKVTIIPDKSMNLIHPKVSTGSIKKLAQAPFTLNPFNNKRKILNLMILHLIRSPSI